MNSNSNTTCELSRKYDKPYYFYSEEDYSSEPPDIYELFRYYNVFFFNEKLSACEVKWSKRMTLCAGTCAYSGMNNCTITLSESLLQFRTNNDVKQTLLHEMIHAFLFLTNPEACRAEEGHGIEFKTIMTVINDMTGLNITVYHTFHDEVDIMRKHVWKCDGPCKEKPPFFGIVKRAMNRAPGPKDYWHERHKRECGGNFTKIAGPEMSEGGEVINKENKITVAEKTKKGPKKGAAKKKKKDEGLKERSSTIPEFFKKKSSIKSTENGSEAQNPDKNSGMTQTSIERSLSSTDISDTTKSVLITGPPVDSLTVDVYLIITQEFASSKEINKMLLMNLEIAFEKDLDLLKSIIKSLFFKSESKGEIETYVDKELEIPLEDEKLGMGYMFEFLNIFQLYMQFNTKILHVVSSDRKEREDLAKGFKINILNDELVDELNYLFYR